MTASTARPQYWFTTSKAGRKAAWTFRLCIFRAVQVPLADAQLAIATGTADEIPGHPFRPGS